MSTPFRTYQPNQRLRQMLAHRIAVAVALGHERTADFYALALALLPSGVRSVKIGKYTTHPAADVLELIDGDEFEQLVEDIRVNGQRDPVMLIRVAPGAGPDPSAFQILDGRNRYRALLKLKRERDARFEYFNGSADPISYVESKNVHRRHLSASQRALVAAEFARLRQGRPKTGKFAGIATQGRAAAKLSVSERSVRTARTVLDTGTPAVVTAVRRGKIAVDAAADLARLPPAKQREILKRFEGAKGEVKSGHVRALVRQEQRRAVAAKIDAETTPLPLGPFRVFVADVPWPYENSDGHTGSRGHTPYPSMSIDEICALGPKILDIAHDDAALWFWCTNTHLVNGATARVLDAWRWKGLTMLTWKKDRMGLGTVLRGQTEHCILATRGSPVFAPGTDTTWIEGDVREHSRKPESFYELVERRCAGAKVEIFCQTPRPSWARWGAESEKYASGAA